MRREQEYMDCVFCIDDHYSQHLGVALASIMINNTQAKFAFHVVNTGISEENKQKLSEVVSTNGDHNTIEFYYFDAKRYSHFRTGGHIRIETYLRLFISDIIPRHIDKVLYLDSDIVVVGSLQELWDHDFHENIIIGAPDPYSQSSLERLKIDSNHPYINAGVLLIDLRSWRELHSGATMQDYVEEHESELKFHDQDVINKLFSSKIRVTSPKWNFQARTRNIDLYQIGYRHDEYDSIAKDIRIIHFTTDKKPWNYRDAVTYEEIYMEYIKYTPWTEFDQIGRSFSNWTMRHLDRPISKVRWFFKKRMPAIYGRTQRG